MSEFVEVMEKYQDLCATHTCKNCPVSEYIDDDISCAKWITLNPEKAEKVIMGREPTYPTWKQWQDTLFPVRGLGEIYPCCFMPCNVSEASICMGARDCQKQHIPADIAQKLGIKPGKEWE